MASRQVFAPIAPSSTARIVTQHLAQARSHAPRWAALTAALLVALTACGDDPFSSSWYDTPDTTFIYSLARPELNLVSGFNFYERTPVRVESPSATGTWDVALDTQGGALVLLPPGALGVTGRAGIASLGAVAFDEIVQAPGDTLLYELDDPVPMTLGHVYAIRTNRALTGFGSSCVYYAKLEPTTLDVPEGRMWFRFVASRLCNNRDLVSPD